MLSEKAVETESETEKPTFTENLKKSLIGVTSALDDNDLLNEWLSDSLKLLDTELVVDFDEDALVLFVNYITLRSADDIKRFVDIYSALDKATCSKCGCMAEFADKTQADVRVMKINLDEQGNCAFEIIAVD